MPLVQLAGKHVYRTFVKNKVQIFEFYGSNLHAKTMTIDGIYSSIGSFNLDTWSDSYNHELNITTVDPDIAIQLESQFQKDLQESKLVTLADLDNTSLFQRILQWCAYQFLTRVFSKK